MTKCLVNHFATIGTAPIAEPALSKYERRFTTVGTPTAATEHPYGYDYTWDYGSYIIEARFYFTILESIKVFDPKDLSNCIVAYYPSCEIGYYDLSNQNCVDLISGDKELVERAFKDIHARLLREVNDTTAVLKLFRK